MKLFLACLVAGVVLFPIAGRYLAHDPVATDDQAAWCAAFETRDEFSREEAGRYLDYCDHFDMVTQKEMPGRLVR